MACNALVYAFLAELFPFHVRAKGITLSQRFSRMAGFFNQFVDPIGIANAGWKYYMSYCVFLAFKLAFVYFLFPETAHRTLEELAFCTFFFSGHERTGSRDPSIRSQSATSVPVPSRPREWTIAAHKPALNLIMQNHYRNHSSPKKSGSWAQTEEEFPASSIFYKTDFNAHIVESTPSAPSFQALFPVSGGPTGMANGSRLR